MSESDQPRIADPDFLWALLEPDARVTARQRESVVEYQTLGELLLPSGRVGACDPWFWTHESEPFDVGFSARSGEVALWVARFESDRRVAAAVLRVGARDPDRWEMAMTPRQRGKPLGPHQYWGYGVDSGTGSLGSPEAYEAKRQEVLDPSGRYDDRLLDAMQPNDVATYSWANYRPVGSDANLIAFSSGWGDGLYPSYVGRGQDNVPVCLLTDFFVFDSASHRTDG